MLVFACGLMLSLVMYWNVDLNSSKTVPVEASSETVSEDELKDDSGDPDAEGSGFEEVGKVFRDPASGKLYMSKDAAEATGAGGIGAGATGRGGS
jgi:hypothetical protein